MKRFKGIMMIELLLVITLAAIIIFVGLRVYLATHHTLELDLIKHDVQTIRMALNRYYEQQVCDSEGVLDIHINTDVLSQLDIQPQLKARVPYVLHYAAKIIATKSQTITGKPIYKLQVSAKFNDGHTQVWHSLPENTTVTPKGLLWVMNVSRDQFRHLKNDKKLNQLHMLYSHAYCAH